MDQQYEQQPTQHPPTWQQRMRCFLSPMMRQQHHCTNPPTPEPPPRQEHFDACDSMMHGL